jgi:hypothetical protein
MGKHYHNPAALTKSPRKAHTHLFLGLSHRDSHESCVYRWSSSLCTLALILVCPPASKIWRSVLLIQQFILASNFVPSHRFIIIVYAS